MKETLNWGLANFDRNIPFILGEDGYNLIPFRVRLMAIFLHLWTSDTPGRMEERRGGENTGWGGFTVLNPKGLEISLPFTIIVFLYAPFRLDEFCWLVPKLRPQAFLLPFSEHTDSDSWLVQAQVFSKKARVHEQWWFPQDTVQQASIVLQSFYLPGKRFKVIYVLPPAQPSKKPESLRRNLVFVCWLRKKEFFSNSRKKNQPIFFFRPCL